jgi:hypothetical protein
MEHIKFICLSFQVISTLSIKTYVTSSVDAVL